MQIQTVSVRAEKAAVKLGLKSPEQIAADGLGALFSGDRSATMIDDEPPFIHGHRLNGERVYACSQHAFMLPEGSFQIGWEMGDAERNDVITRQYFGVNWLTSGHVCTFRHRDKRGRFIRERVLFATEGRDERERVEKDVRAKLNALAQMPSMTTFIDEKEKQ